MAHPGSSTPPEKFFFTHNIFDAPVIDENAPPPPPMFSETELAAARREAFEEGKRHAADEHRKSLEISTAKTLESIGRQISTLSDTEAQREKAYEREVLALVQGIVKTVLPAYTERHGTEEIASLITGILASHEDKAGIRIAVPAEAADTIRQRIATALPGLAPQLDITADSTITGTDCRIVWQDGGAVRNTAALLEAVHKSFNDLLAGTPAAGHDKPQHTEETPP